MTPDQTVDALLSRRIGLDASTVGVGLIRRAIQIRMNALALHHTHEYLPFLLESEPEQAALVEEVVIPESWFFRDDGPFQLFAEHVRTHWLDQPERLPLRSLSIPCAGGEEPYSLAIALMELGLPSERWTIEAVDVSTRGIERATRGIYSENAFRGCDRALRSKYFHAVPREYELAQSVREKVGFRHGNLLDANLLLHAPSFDVIFCRNLLIYLDVDSRRRALAVIDRLLEAKGLLFLGHAERLEAGDARFESVGGKGCFAYRRTGSTPTATSQHAPGKPRSDRARNLDSPGGAKASSAWKVVDRAPASKRARLKEMPQKPPLAAPETTTSSDALLEDAAALADQGLHGQAAALCESLLRESGANSRAYFLLGMIRQAEGDAVRAESCFQKTVYLDPRHDEALLALAMLTEGRGDPAAAAGYRRRVERALLKKETP